jgi:Domain of unknown function (DUF4184)
MPFTLAHAAAALPVRRAGFIVSALVVGTFGPDLEYYLLLSPRSRYGHHWPGVLFFTFPACLAALWLFHACIKRPAIALMPPAIERRLLPFAGEFRFGGVRRFSGIVASIWAGIATHVVWDSFTHRNSWTVRHWPLLLKTTVVPLLGVMPVCQLLQHVSSAFGMAVVAVWFAFWLRTARAAEPEPGGFRPAQRLAIVSAMSLAAAAAAAMRTLTALGAPHAAHAMQGFYVIWGITAVSFFTLEMLAYGVWWTRRQARFVAAAH